MSEFNRVLVANRGEIAVRVIQACTEMGIETAAVHSQGDESAKHVRLADDAREIGPDDPQQSYLNSEALLGAAQRMDADAIHPGYGFLAEQADFARQVEESDITWIGPPSDAIRKMGEKTRARSLMRQAGVPIVPGTTDPVDDVSAVRSFGNEHGYPVAIKAAAGGGGRGFAVAQDADEVETALARAQREGEAYFDDDTVYVEKYLNNPRHIEIQILADQHGNTIHLGERDCSVQRRHQKLLEEAPAPELTADQRDEIATTAIKAAEAVEYTNAGTVEFIFQDGEYYFLEMNTRIQVEHPVTEIVTGHDIVRLQIYVAMDQPLPFDQSEVGFHGHAIECRLNVEDPDEDFKPTPGTITTYDPPTGPGVRLDTDVYQGYTVSGKYDSMIGKLIVWDESREKAIKRARRALSEFTIDGPKTTIPFHERLLDNPDFIAANVTTPYVDEWLSGEDSPTFVDDDLPAGSESTGSSVNRSNTARPVEADVNLSAAGRSFRVAATTDYEPRTRQQERTPDQERSGLIDGQVTAPMDGKILKVPIEIGESVGPDDIVCVLEAMKMENNVEATVDGDVREICVEPGDSVTVGDPLVVIE